MTSKEKNRQIPSNGRLGLATKIKGTLVTKNLHLVCDRDRLSNSQFEFQMKAIKMIRFMQPLADFMNQIKTKPFIGSSRLSTLLTHNIQHAFKDSARDLTLDYRQLIVSKGHLSNAPGISVSSPIAGRLVFRWTDNSGIGKARASDLVFVAVFNREFKHWIFAAEIARRSALLCMVDVNPFRFKKVQTYIGFVSEDGELISTSVYAGEVRVL